VALASPMSGGVAVDAPIDDAALARLVELHVEAGTEAIVAVGTTGESATVDFDEHCRLIGRVIELAAGRIPVIAGTGANATAEAIALTRSAAAAGADGALLVTPYYNKPTQEGLYRHHRAVAEAADLPQLLYNVPGRTACDMLPETVGRLAELPNIVGLKEATGDIERVAALRSRCPADFVLLSGDDATALDFMLAGGDGVVSVTANVAPALMRRMCRLAREGEVEAARDVNQKLMRLHVDLFAESNPIPTKWALAQMGLIGDGIRLPLTWLSPEHHDRVRSAMAAAGIEAPG